MALRRLFSTVLKIQASAGWLKISKEHPRFIMFSLEKKMWRQVVEWYLWYTENLRNYILVALIIAQGPPPPPPQSLSRSLGPAKCRPLLVTAEQQHRAFMGQVSIMWNFLSAKVPRSFPLYFPRGHCQNLSIEVISVGSLLSFPTLKRSFLPSWNSSSQYSSLLVSKLHPSTQDQPLWRSVSVSVR